MRPARDDFAKKIATLFFRLLRDRLLGLAGEGGGRLRRADPATKVVPAKRLQGQGRSGAGQKNTLASVSGKTNQAVLFFFPAKFDFIRWRCFGICEFLRKRVIGLHQRKIALQVPDASLLRIIPLELFFFCETDQPIFDPG